MHHESGETKWQLLQSIQVFQTDLEEKQVTSRKWVYLFISTLLIGGIATIITGFAIELEQYLVLFQEAEVIELLSVIVWLFGLGLMFSLISQMGFFAYLTVHRFGLGMFKSLWNGVQIVIIAFVLFDLVYFRHPEGQALLPYLLPAIFLLLYGVIVAYVKAKETNKGAFVPALFFLIVVTTLEWFPALRTDNEDWLYLMFFPLLISNTWQLLLLHRLTEQK